MTGSKSAPPDVLPAQYNFEYAPSTDLFEDRLNNLSLLNLNTDFGRYDPRKPLNPIMIVPSGISSIVLILGGGAVSLAAFLAGKRDSAGKKGGENGLS